MSPLLFNLNFLNNKKYIKNQKKSNLFFFQKNNFKKK